MNLADSRPFFNNGGLSINHSTEAAERAVLRKQGPLRTKGASQAMTQPLSGPALKAVVRSRDDLAKFFGQVVGRLGDTFDKPYTVSLRRFHRPRSLSQNAKIHAMWSDLAEHTGHSPSEIKDYFKSEFGFTKTITVAGRERTIPKGTSEYSVEECAVMIERIYQVAAEAGCDLEI